MQVLNQPLLPPSALSGISPSRGEIGARGGPQPISPFEGEMPDRAEGDKAAISVVVALPDPHLLGAYRHG